MEKPENFTHHFLHDRDAICGTFPGVKKTALRVAYSVKGSSCATDSRLPEWMSVQALPACSEKTAGGAGNMAEQ
jgi:hypothetical protein